VSKESNIWLSKAKKENTVYAYITKTDWKRGDRKNFILKSVKATANTKISVLGQNDLVCEYQSVIPTSKFNQTANGLEISVVRAQRIYNANDWDNPIVVKLENVEAAMTPVVPVTIDPIRISSDRIEMSGKLSEVDSSEDLKVGFLYREYGGFHESIYSDKWEITKLKKYKTGEIFKANLKKLKADKDYQIRTVVEQNGVLIPGKIIKCRKLKKKAH